MANLFFAYSIKERKFSGPFETSQAATDAIRKHVGKSGAIGNQKLSGAASADFEVITVTK